MKPQRQSTASPAELELWVLEAQRGNRHALALLYKQLNPALKRFALLQCQDPNLALDACQDAWERCCKKLRQLKDPASFRGWLYSCTRNRILDLLRKENKAQEKETVIESTTEQDEVFTQHEMRLTLWRLINSLPLQERQCVYLFYQQGFSLQEITLALDISLGTVKSQLYRARKHLFEKLSDENDGELL